MTDPTFPSSEYQGEPAPLGTAATMSKRESDAQSGTPSSEGKARPKGGNDKGPSSRRPRLGFGAGATAIVVLVVAMAMVPLLGTALKKTPRDRIGISYGGGPIEGSHFQKVVEPGSGLFFNGFFDPLYLYPADQQTYIVSNAPGDEAADDDTVVAPTSDRVQIQYQVAVYFKLNTDRLQEFHEEWGLKYEAFEGDGWNRLVRDTLRQQIENALQEETRRYAVADIYGDADLLVNVQDSVQVTLSARLDAAMGGNFFCAPTYVPGGECNEPVFIIKRADVPEAVSAAYERNRTSELEIVTRQNEVQQRIEEAKGIEALGAALAESGQAYVLLKAIEAGDIDFWVLPSDGSVNLSAPREPTPPAGG